MASASNSLWSTLWLSVLRPALIGGLFVLGLGVACSDQSKLNSAQLSVSSNNPTPDAMGPCPDGLRRECGVTLGRQGDVVNCAKGAQLCSAGKWGTCEETSKFDVSATASGSPLKTLSLSMPAPCVNNPCDPACRIFNEMPTSPYQGEVDPSTVWNTGSLLDYPTTTNARVEPCTATSDCQAGSECDPVLKRCVRHVAGQTDSSCVGAADLIVAPTCLGAGGVAPVPVCNRGSMSAPAGVKVVVLAAGQIRTLNPSTAAASTVTCLTPQAIPPGKCIDVIGCGAIANGSEIMVNPQDGLQKPECEVNNNWSVYQNGACNSAICQAGNSTGTIPGTCAIPLRGTQNVGATLLGRWPFDEGSGITAADVSGKGNALTLNMGTLWSAGRQGNAMVASPTGPKVALRSATDLGDTTSVSVAFWMKNNAANNYDAGLVSHLSSTAKGWQVQRTVAGKIQVLLSDGAATTTVSAYGASPAPNDNNWHHVAFTWTGTTGALLVYVDGLVTESTTHMAASLGSGGRTFRVGRAQVLGLVFNGALDDVSVYRGVLSPKQVLLMSQAQGVTTGAPNYARAKYTPPPPPANTTPKCKAGETYWGNKCYRPGEDDVHQAALEQFCVDLGSHLISINRPEERDFAATLHDYSTTKVWNGLTDEVAEGTWVWTDGSCTAFRDWSLSPNGVQPNSASASEDCVYSDFAQSDFDTDWRDVPCDLGDAAPKPESICERVPDNAQGVCAANQWAGPDSRCYQLETTPMTYAQASAACSVKGAGWALASVMSTPIVNFVGGLLDCQQAWMGTVLGGNFAPGSSGATGCVRTDALGKWVDAVCTGTRPYLCAGPAPGSLPEDLVRVASATACSGSNQEYYLDDVLYPTLMTLCPTMCTRIAGTSGAIAYEYGCQPAFAAKVVTQTYTSDCPTGTQAQWSFLTYTSATPNGSSIQFDARTALDVPSLAAAPFVSMANAATTPINTQSCTYSGPSGCPVNLFTKLGVNNNLPILELRATLEPGPIGAAPSLTKWEVAFSCQPAQ